MSMLQRLMIFLGLLCALPATLPAAFPTAIAATPQNNPSAFPSRAVKLVVTAAAGGITDIMARILADPLARSLGQAVIVENRPGAGGNIAVGLVAKAAPDGYTLVIVNVGNASIARHLNRELPFDPLHDLVGVAAVGEVPSIAAIHAALPVRNLREFIDYGRAQPGTLNYGSAGNATMPHLAAEMLASLANLKLTHVPYKGGGPAAIDLAAGRIQIALLGIGSMQAQLAAGSVRAIAVASRQRLAALPEVPTFEQAGLTGYDATNWFGIQAPKGISAELVRTLNDHFNRASNDPGLQKRYADAGILPIRESVEVFQKRILDDHVRWREVVRTAGIKAE